MPGRGRVDVPLGLVGERLGQLDEPRRRPAGRGRAGRAAGRWRPGRCGSGRRAACRRARRAAPAARARARCARPRPRRWAGTAPARTAASSSSRAPSIRPARRRRAARPGQDPGVRPGRGRSYGASRQSKCTDTDSRASASARAAAPNRPPHSRGRPRWRSALDGGSVGARVTARPRPARSAGRAARGDLARQAPQLDEALAPATGRTCRRRRRWPGEVVERRLAAPAGRRRARPPCRVSRIVAGRRAR